jgi:hypothetical protein
MFQGDVDLPIPRLNGDLPVFMYEVPSTIMPTSKSFSSWYCFISFPLLYSSSSSSSKGHGMFLNENTHLKVCCDSETSLLWQRNQLEFAVERLKNFFSLCKLKIDCLVDWLISCVVSCHVLSNFHVNPWYSGWLSESIPSSDEWVGGIDS